MLQVLSSVKNGFYHTQLASFFEYQDRPFEQRQRFFYELSYWEGLCETLEDTQRFLLFLMIRWKTQANDKFYHKIAKKLEYTNKSVEASIQNICLNKCFSSNFEKPSHFVIISLLGMSYEESMNLCKMNLEMSFFVFILHTNMFDQLRSSENLLIEEEMSIYKAKICKS